MNTQIQTKRAEKALRDYTYGEAVSDDNICDLIADLMHLCNLHDFDAQEIWLRAWGHYCAESKNKAA